MFLIYRKYFYEFFKLSVGFDFIGTLVLDGYVFPPGLPQKNTFYLNNLINKSFFSPVILICLFKGL